MFNLLSPRQTVRYFTVICVYKAAHLGHCVVQHIKYVSVNKTLDCALKLLVLKLSIVLPNVLWD